MGRHLVDVFDRAKTEIIVADTNELAFKKAAYGEPRVITQWPFLSVQPQNKIRELKATRKFSIVFVIWVMIYHGKIAPTFDIQEGAHKRIEAVENFLMTDFKWNFIDSTDSAKHKVIFGFPTAVDHPVVLAPEEELWAASRLELRATSEEVF
jgi:hypothetical protein